MPARRGNVILGHNSAMTAPPPRRSNIRIRSALAAAAVASCTTATASPIEDTVRRFVLQQTADMPGQVRVTVDPLDTATHIAACTALSPSLPAGARLWGKTSVTVTCLAPTRWVVYVPVRVQVIARHLRSAKHLPAGQPLSWSDLVTAEGDLTELPAGTVTEPAQAIGRSLRFGLAAGQPIRTEQLVAPLAVKQGQAVRLVVQGAGFSVASEGTALANAADGATVTAKTASGQTVKGTARAGGIIEISN